MSTKRTYSRRSMTMAPLSHRSPSDDVSSSKRRKEEYQIKAKPGHEDSCSENTAPQKPQAKKFSGPVSMSYDEMDLDTTSKGSFERALNHALAKRAAPAPSHGSLHGSREQFDSLITGAKKVLGKGKDKTKARIESRNTLEEHTTKAKSLQREKNGKATVTLTKAEVTAIARRAFDSKEYQSTTLPPPSLNLYGKRIEADSNLRKLWCENQAGSPLLRLPGELRNRIYDLVLGGHRIDILFQNYDPETGLPVFKYHSIVTKAGSGSQAHHRPVERTRGMTLLNSVCRQLYTETAVLPYMLNRIVFHAYNTMFNFLVMERRLTASQRESITEITVYFEVPCQHILKLLPNLQHVRVVSPDNWNLANRYATRGLYRVVADKKGPRLEKVQWDHKGGQRKF